MSPEDTRPLEARVVRAAEAALADHHYVSAIDVLTGMGLLAPSQVADWRRGRTLFLEQVIQGNLGKISRSMALFRQWARARGLKPSETHYVGRTRAGTVDLQFSKSGDPEIERAYRTHYVSPDLGERKRRGLEEKLSRPPERVVFAILRDSRCSECGGELEAGSFLLMEADHPLCLPCGGLGDLECLPAGDAALTRRAARYSARSAVVVRFSRSRGRYERQGILVEVPALEKAEQECASDADERARQRQRNAARRQEQDRELVAAMSQRIQALFPDCPPDEVQAIAAHTATRGSGRVGRSAAGRSLDEGALTLAVIAAVRHNRTDYEVLLSRGLDRDLARDRVRAKVEEILEEWRRRE